jgi:putative endonuclease
MGSLVQVQRGSKSHLLLQMAFLLMAHFVYILFSKTTNKFYIGETPNLIERLEIHNDYQRNTNSTKSGIPWEIYYAIQVADRIIARKIEVHIKKMKRKLYIENLKKYPEVITKLTEYYS